MPAISPASATIDPALLDIRRYVYVPAVASDQVAVVDSDSNRITGTLATGVVPRRVVVSRDTATLVAADSKAASLSLVNVFSGDRRLLDLPVQATGLTVGTSGRIAAAFNEDSGMIILIDLDEGWVKSVIPGPRHLHDVMFDGQDTRLLVGAEGLPGIGVVDVQAAQLTHQIALPAGAAGGISAFARTPDGRHVLARSLDGGVISIVDPEEGKAVGQIASAGGVEGMFPSGTGSYLLVPDTEKSVLKVFRSTRPAAESVELPMSAGVTGVYFAWLDSVAFLPSPERNRLLVYDLDRMSQVSEIVLPGPPSPGTVTADSRALYLPVRDPPRLLVVSGETRAVVAQIDLKDAPHSALVAGGWGICH
jgi:hypothetical protein